MKRVFFILGIILFVQHFSLGQTDTLSLEKQILDYRPVKPEIITKGRVMLADLFPEGDWKKVMEIINYLTTEIDSKGYEVFTPHEKILISYWTGNYSDVLKEVKQVEGYGFPPRGWNTRPHYTHYWRAAPDSENLASVMAMATLPRVDSLMAKVRSSPQLREDEREFLCVYLMRIFSEWEESGITKDALSHDAETFTNKFPDSQYYEYAARYVVPKPAVFGGGFDLSPVGCNIFTQELSDKFKNCYGFGVGLDIYWKRAVLYGNIMGNFSRTQQDIPVSNDSLVWKTGKRANLFMVHSSVGYLILDKKKIAIAPFAGIAFTRFLPDDETQKNHEELEDFTIKSYAYTTGINIEFVLQKSNDSDPNTHLKSSAFFRLRYTCFLPQFQKKYEGYSGIINNITLGIGCSFRPDRQKINSKK